MRVGCARIYPFSIERIDYALKYVAKTTKVVLSLERGMQDGQEPASR